MSTLIKTTAELKSHLQVEAATYPETFLPDIRRAQNFYLLNILGATLLNSLQAAVDAETLSSDQENLLTYCNDVLAPLAYYQMVPKLNLRISDDGLHTTTNGDKERAMRWQVGELKMQLLKDGYMAIDKLYQYLETGPFATDWKETDSFKSFKKYLVSSATEYQNFANIGESRWLLSLALPTMGNISARFIIPVLGSEFYEELLTAYKGTPSANQLVLIEKIQRALVLLTHSFVLRDRSIRSELMVMVGNRAEGVSKEELNQSFFEQSEDYKMFGESALNEAKIWLNANASLFTTYQESSLYVDPNNTKEYEYRNQESKGSFFL